MSLVEHVKTTGHVAGNRSALLSRFVHVTSVPLSDGQRDAYPLNDRKITSQRCPPSDNHFRGSAQSQANIDRLAARFLVTGHDTPSLASPA